MAMTDAERKRRQRQRQKFNGVQTRPFTMDLTKVEREAINEAADARGFEDRTEYLLRLVYHDRDMSRKENVCTFPKCDCPYDMGPDGKCVKGLQVLAANSDENPDHTPCAWCGSHKPDDELIIESDSGKSICYRCIEQYEQDMERRNTFGGCA